MKLAALTASLALALAAGAVDAQTSAPKGGHEHGAPPPCCDTGAQTKVYKTSGVVKKTDSAKSTATIAHGAVQELNWPAMTMTFKVKDRALLPKLADNKKVDFTFAQEGRNYVITAVQ